MQLPLEVGLHGKYLLSWGHLCFLRVPSHMVRGGWYILKGSILLFAQQSKGLKAEMSSLVSSTILMDAFGRNKVVLVGWGQCPNSSTFSEKIGAQSKIHGADRVLKPSTVIPWCWALLTSLRHNYEPEMPPLRMWPVDTVCRLGSQG